MLVHLTAVQLLGGHRVRLRFDDGVEGDVDIAQVVPFAGVFAALADDAFFAQVRVDPAWGALAWPNDVDLAPEPLYQRITGRAPWIDLTRPAERVGAEPRKP